MRCSVQQGNGIAVRKRLCRHSNIENLYTSCFGPHTEISKCYVPGGKTDVLFLNFQHLVTSVKILVDGGWSEWKKWTPCSALCDRGVRYRMRSCSRPEPEEFGQTCSGEYVQTSDCHVEPCKGKNEHKYTMVCVYSIYIISNKQLMEAAISDCTHNFDTNEYQKNCLTLLEVYLKIA